MKTAAIILTFNESIHLERCIESVSGIVDEVIVADSFSTDDTVEIAQHNGARVIQKEWVNHANQFNWALTQLDRSVDWVLRIDADEYLTSGLRAEISTKLSNMSSDVCGIYIPRRISFMGRQIQHGGIFPVLVLRIFRLGRGECENRWMDEHIRVNGDTAIFTNELIDDNRNSLTWWVNKHNNYASREVVDLLNYEYKFMDFDTLASIVDGSQTSRKRWIKENVYSRLPGGTRAFLYFFYRYCLRLGFLDGKEGMIFHFLQAFWYRYLVDAKIHEVTKYMRDHNCEIEKAIKDILDIDVTLAL